MVEGYDNVRATGEFSDPKHGTTYFMDVEYVHRNKDLVVTIDGKSATYHVVSGKEFDPKKLCRIDAIVGFVHLEAQIMADLNSKEGSKIRGLLQKALGAEVRVV